MDRFADFEEKGEKDNNSTHQNCKVMPEIQKVDFLSSTESGKCIDKKKEDGTVNQLKRVKGLTSRTGLALNPTRYALIHFKPM